MSRTVRLWPLLALIASAALLGIAHAFESFGHLMPCELCLKQRDVYWVAMAASAAGLLWVLIARDRAPIRWINAIIAFAFAAEAGVAIYHAGVEWKFWPGPQSCSGGALKVSAAALERLLSGAHMGVPACDKPAWIFLGLSMAGWNALAALILTTASGMAAVSARPAS
ncbi:MAG TPA: disulfide bond formation protein B [Caulobacteraceae bacterium]